MHLIDDEDIDLDRYMVDPEVNKIKPASDWTQQVIDHYHKPPEANLSAKLPWSKTVNIFRFRDGEVSIIGGINGHGKSLIWGQVALDLIDQGERVCIASLEMKPYRTMVRMARQASGTDEPSVRWLKALGKWTDGKLWLYDHIGNCKPHKMIALIRYAVDKFKIKHFIIDNLTKVIPGEDNLNGQKDFVNDLCNVAAELGIHIHLVMHVRKGMDENKPPNKMDLKGAGAVTDMVDNIFVVWRNKEKERQIREGNMAEVPEPDALLILMKQRNADGDQDEATFLFWFDTMSHQYIEDRNGLIKQYHSITKQDEGITS